VVIMNQSIQYSSEYGGSINLWTVNHNWDQMVVEEAVFSIFAYILGLCVLGAHIFNAQKLSMVC
jgi:hypothetical protein